MMLEAVKTPITPADVATALRAAWIKLFEAEPADQQIAVLMAQSALETGRWRSCWNFNLGNIKPGKAWAGGTYQVRCNEVIKGRLEWFDPPHPQTTFRAYTSLEDAAADYLWTLRRRFGVAWEYVLRGDPVGFSQALKRQNYYTASEPPYTAAVKSLFLHYLQMLLADPADTLPPEPGHDESIAQTIVERSGFDALALADAAFDAVSEIRDEAKKDMLDGD